MWSKTSKNLMEVQGQFDDDHGNTHGGKRNLNLWKNTAVESLIKLVKENYERLNSREEQKGVIWKEILEKLQNDASSKQAPDITPKQVEIKWHNIRMRYLKFKAIQNLEGAGSKIKSPAYYQLLESFSLEEAPIAYGQSYKYVYDFPNFCPVTSEDSLGRSAETYHNMNNHMHDNSQNHADQVMHDLNNMGSDAPHSIFNPNYKSMLLSDICEEIVNKEDLNHTCNEPPAVEATGANVVAETIDVADIVECQMEEDEPTVSHGGKRDIYMWNNKATEALILLIKENYKNLNMKEVKSQKVWRSITQRLQNHVPGLTPKQARIKWRNIRQNYIKFKFRRTAKAKMPPHYKLLASFLLVRPVAPRMTSTFSPDGEDDYTHFSYYQERLNLEEHLKKSERATHELVSETKKSNKLMEKLLEKMDNNSKSSVEFHTSMMRIQETMIQKLHESSELQRNFFRMNHQPHNVKPYM